MNKKAIGYLLLGTSLAFAQGAFVRPAGGQFGGRGGFGAQRVIVKNAPFSAIEVRTFQQQMANGNAINRTSQTVIYRDSEGRMREEAQVPATASKPAHTITTISDVVAGKRYVLDSSTNTYHTMRMAKAGGWGGNAQARSAHAPGTGSGSAAVSPRATGRGGDAAATRTELGSQMKNGILATGTRETRVTPAGKIGNAQAITVERETWLSSQLHRPVEVKVTDAVRGNETIELTNIVAVEPGADKFTVPAGYTEQKGGPGGRGAFRGARPGAGAQQ